MDESRLFVGFIYGLTVGVGSTSLVVVWFIRRIARRMAALMIRGQHG